MRWSGGAFLAIACAAGCAEDQTTTFDSLESSSRGVSIVDVTLVEFAVTATPATARAGNVLFRLHNIGDEDVHEFVVVKTDLSIPELPTNPDGSFDEEGEGVEVLDEVETIKPGASHGIVLKLEAGHYVLLCNRVEVEEDGEVESHFAEGMRTDFNLQ